MEPEQQSAGGRPVYYPCPTSVCFHRRSRTHFQNKKEAYHYFFSGDTNFLALYESLKIFKDALCYLGVFCYHL